MAPEKPLAEAETAKLPPPESALIVLVSSARMLMSPPALVVTMLPRVTESLTVPVSVLVDCAPAPAPANVKEPWLDTATLAATPTVNASMDAFERALTVSAPPVLACELSIFAITSAPMMFLAIEMPRATEAPASTWMAILPEIAIALIAEVFVASTSSVVVPVKMALSETKAEVVEVILLPDPVPAPATLIPNPEEPVFNATAPAPAIVRASMVDEDVARMSAAPTRALALASFTSARV